VTVFCEGEEHDERLSMFTTARLNAWLTDTWPHGAVESVGSTRIGEDYGFGGHVYRLDVETATGSRSLVAKRETSDEVSRVVDAYRQMGEGLSRRVPALYGWADEVTLFELIDPATQGDGLDFEKRQVETLIQLLADLHAATWSHQPGTWSTEHWDEARWQARLELAGERYPDLMTDRLRHRLVHLHEEMPAAISRMQNGPVALVHMDSGYDNTLWRPDGSLVLLDWSNSGPGPPTLDLAAHITDADPARVIDVYTSRLQENDLKVRPQEVVAGLQQSTRLFVRGMVGFAGRPGEPDKPRLRLFRDSALDVVRRSVEWIDGSS
jgi:hypothetical protein